MRLILHTLQKDLRRLWPAAAITWVMLGSLARADRWRADWIASPMEGWMNLLLTMAWVMLAALAVLEETARRGPQFLDHPSPQVAGTALGQAGLCGARHPSPISACRPLCARSSRVLAHRPFGPPVLEANPLFRSCHSAINCSRVCGPQLHALRHYGLRHCRWNRDPERRISELS